MMRRAWHHIVLRSLLSSMKKKASMPGHIQLAEAHDLYSTLVFDHVETHALMHSKACQGMAPSPTLATIKGLVEYLERKGAHESSCLFPQGTDGLAAWPCVWPIPRGRAQAEARKRAWAEAFERYVWARWADEADIGFDLYEWDRAFSRVPQLVGLKDYIHELSPIDCIQVVRPHCPNPMRGELLIICAFFQDGSCALGGAASIGDNHAAIAYRATSELIRHVIALKRYRSKGYPARTFYEQRLVFLGSERGGQLVRSRLQERGSRRIELPSLSFDREIQHPYEELVVIHQCLFTDQPAFIGGALERPCL